MYLKGAGGYEKGMLSSESLKNEQTSNPRKKRQLDHSEIKRSSQAEIEIKQTLLNRGDEYLVSSRVNSLRVFR